MHQSIYNEFFYSHVVLMFREAIEQISNISEEDLNLEHPGAYFNEMTLEQLMYLSMKEENEDFNEKLSLLEYQKRRLVQLIFNATSEVVI